MLETRSLSLIKQSWRIGVFLQNDKSPKGDPVKQIVKELNPLVEEAREVVTQISGGDGGKQPQDDYASTISTISSSLSTSEGHQSSDHGQTLSLYIQSLLELGPAIENNLIQIERRFQDAKQRALTLPNFAYSEPAQGYISSIRDKFPRASAELVGRLGEANWQRHVKVRDRMTRDDEDVEMEFAEHKVSGAIAPSAIQPVSVFHDSGIGTTLSGRTKYARSTASHTSFASSFGGENSRSVRVPPNPPEIGLGKPFRCFICHRLQETVRNRADWKYEIVVQ